MRQSPDVHVPSTLASCPVRRVPLDGKMRPAVASGSMHCIAWINTHLRGRYVMTTAYVSCVPFGPKTLLCAQYAGKSASSLALFCLERASFILQFQWTVEICPLEVMNPPS